jgi:hypothetical protein
MLYRAPSPPFWSPVGNRKARPSWVVLFNCGWIQSGRNINFFFFFSVSSRLGSVSNATSRPTNQTKDIYTHTHSQPTLDCWSHSSLFQDPSAGREKSSRGCAVSGYDMLQLHIYKFTQYVLLLLGLSVIFQKLLNCSGC